MVTLIVLLSPILITALITGLSGVIGGGALGYVFFNIILRNRRKNIINDAETEGEVIKKDKILQAKEKFLQLKT